MRPLENLAHPFAALGTLGLLPLCAACTVVEPLGWPAERRPAPTRKIVATPGVVYGYAPLSWDLSDGRTVVVDVDELRMPPLARAAELDFTVGYRDDPGHAIRCATGLDPGAKGWFRCTGVDAQGQPVTFTMGVDADCELSVTRHMQTYKTLACWEGEAQLSSGAVQLDRGYFERNGIAVGYVSWVRDGQPIYAANIVGELSISVYDGAGSHHPDDEELALLTIALHWFEHASSD